MEDVPADKQMAAPPPPTPPPKPPPPLIPPAGSLAFVCRSLQNNYKCRWWTETADIVILRTHLFVELT